MPATPDFAGLVSDAVSAGATAGGFTGMGRRLTMPRIICIQTRLRRIWLVEIQGWARSETCGSRPYAVPSRSSPTVKFAMGPVSMRRRVLASGVLASLAEVENAMRPPMGRRKSARRRRPTYLAAMERATSRTRTAEHMPNHSATPRVAPPFSTTEKVMEMTSRRMNERWTRRSTFMILPMEMDERSIDLL
jgi:hypothetical protein